MLNREIEKKIKDHESVASNLQQQVNNLVLQAGNPDASSAEIVQARGKYDVLNDRLNAIDNTINTEKTNILKEIKDEFNPAKEEVEKSKVDYFGTEHNNLEERLNEDFDNIHQRVNESSLLPYERTNITADNSYYGLIKDLNIKGRTLQNLVNINNYKVSAGTSKQDDIFIITTDTATLQGVTFIDTLTKTNTTYTVLINVISLFNESNGVKIEINDGSYSYSNSLNLGLNMLKISTLDNLTSGYVSVLIRQSVVTGGEFKFKDFMVLEGDYTNTPLDQIPFIEGIKSVGESEVTEDGKYKLRVKSCGKNLIKLPLIQGTFNPNKGNLIDSSKRVRTDFIKVKPNNQYTRYNDETVKFRNLAMYDINKNFIQTNLATSFTTPSDCYYVLIVYSSTIEDEVISPSDFINAKIQLEEGTVATDYEPYKETVVEYLLDEPHMGLPSGAEDIIDEDDVLTKRIGKVVLDGTENWIRNSSLDNEYTERYTTRVVSPTLSSPLICDKLETNTITINDKTIIFAHNTENRLDIKKLKTDDRWTDVLTLKQWLQANPVTVYYELATPITTQLEKQQLFSQDGTTHIFSDNLLPPTISCSIPSNVPAVISTLRLENEELQKENTALTEQIEENNIINIETSLEQDARLTMLELGVN